MLKFIAFFNNQKIDKDAILSADPKYIFWMLSSGMIQNNPLCYSVFLCL